MALSERDKENMSIHSLIGYCQSAKVIFSSSTIRKPELKRWAEGLVEIADCLENKLANPKDEKTS